MEANEAHSNKIDEEFVKDLLFLLFKSQGWMKFLGVLSIIGGIILVISIWGILIAWLYIWIGIILIQAGNAIQTAQLKTNIDFLKRGLKKINTYFRLTGIITLVILIIYTIAVIVILILYKYNNF